MYFVCVRCFSWCQSSLLYSHLSKCVMHGTHSVCVVRCMKIFDACTLCVVIYTKAEPEDPPPLFLSILMLVIHLLYSSFKKANMLIHVLLNIIIQSYGLRIFFIYNRYVFLVFFAICVFNSYFKCLILDACCLLLDILFTVLGYFKTNRFCLVRALFEAQFVFFF